MQLAYALGEVDTHAAHQGPAARRTRASKSDADNASRRDLIETTVGRVMFNVMLPDGHAVLQHADAVQRTGRA